MDISAKVKGIKYKPFCCQKLKTYKWEDIKTKLPKEGSFLIEFKGNDKMAVSKWASPKRTRTYPYARVYDTLNFQGKKVTIIPIIKDEGKAGERDYLQWDTIALMSLLNVYTIISYYSEAHKSVRNNQKITLQSFDMNHIEQEIKNLLSYQSDALHWNISQMKNAQNVFIKAMDAYNVISKKLEIELHSKSQAEERLKIMLEGINNFMSLSRSNAKKAQEREVATIQPKEKLSGNKGSITIINYIGGEYYFTCDEVEIKNNNVYLIEGKHSKNNLPSVSDIKDGLFKMILYVNLTEVEINKKIYIPKPVLKLTNEGTFCEKKLREEQKEFLRNLKKEALTNKFQVLINSKDLQILNI